MLDKLNADADVDVKYFAQEALTGNIEGAESLYLIILFFLYTTEFLRSSLRRGFARAQVGPRETSVVFSGYRNDRSTVLLAIVMIIWKPTLHSPHIQLLRVE